jgi:hypothetical protein
MNFLKSIKHIFFLVLTFFLWAQITFAKTELIYPAKSISCSIEKEQIFKSLEKEVQPNIGFLKQKPILVVSESISAQNTCNFSKWSSYDLANAGARFIAKSGNELKTFLNGVTDLPVGVPYSGKMYRYIPSKYTDAKLIIKTVTSDIDNRFRTGLYLSETKAGNIIEVNSYGGTANKTLYEFTDVQVNNLLDLTNPLTIEKLGTTIEDIKLINGSNPYEFTQEIAIWAKSNGYSGVKFSGTQGGSTNYTNFVIFEQSVMNSAINGNINFITW